jgi:hypothetical protein
MPTHEENMRKLSDALEDGYIGYEEPDDSDDEEARDIDVADWAYTRDWTSVDSAAKADSFVDALMRGATHNEKMYIFNIRNKKSNTAVARDILQEKIDDLESYLSARDGQLQTYADTLGGDVGDTFAKRLVVEPLLEFLRKFLAKQEEKIGARTVVGPGPSGVQVAGSPSDDAKGIRDEHDYRIHQLLKFGDSLHDFDPDPPFSDYNKRRRVIPRDKIRESLGVEIPDDVPSKEGPDGFTRDDVIAHVPSFVEYLITRKEIQFSNGDPVDNPLYDKNILHRFDVHNVLAFTRGELWEAFRLHESSYLQASGLVSPEVWCPLYEDDKEEEEPDPWSTGKRKAIYFKKVVYLAQITRLIREIRDYFGDELTFIMDESDNQLSRMIFATQNIDAAILRKFKVYDDGAWVTATEEESRVNWSYKICDASLFDAQTHLDDKIRDYKYPQVSGSATGFVYREEDPYQVELRGVDLADPENPRVRYALNSGVETHARYDTTEFSQKEMAIKMQALLSRGISDINQELACKRAGDWGQVEHCKQMTSRGQTTVMVTSDRLAAFYGDYRGANLISLNRHHHTNVGPTVRRMLQCTFTMSKPGASRSHIVRDALGITIEPEMHGGSTRMTFAPIVLGLVVVAMALFQ